MSKRRRQEGDTLISPTSKRRKKAESSKIHRNENNNNVNECACFHFAAFKQLPSPHPCLYSSCNNKQFSTWNEWREHWIQQHRKYYMDNKQMIPINEFNDNNPKIKESSFHHINFIATLGSTTKPNSHCILTFDLSLSNKIKNASNFTLSRFREREKLIWDPLKYKEGNTMNHCNSKYWDRIRSAMFCAKNVEYFNNSRILFRCGGYYSSTQNQVNDGSDYNKMSNNSLSSLCDAFDIDNNQHYIMPNLPHLLHSSSLIYIEKLKLLLNIGGDDYQCKPLQNISTLLLNNYKTNELEWNHNNLFIPNMTTKRSYRPSIGLYTSQSSIILFIAGGCNTNYSGLKQTESLNLTNWINSNDQYRNIPKLQYKPKKKNISYKSKWVKQKSMNIPRRDASNLLHWKSQNCMVCCGGDHGEGKVKSNSIKPWYTSEIYDLHKNSWSRIPDFPSSTMHIATPFIWIEGGIKDNNQWSGIRETKLFKNYSSFSSSSGVLCIIGNGFAHSELGNISFYDPRTSKWQTSSTLSLKLEDDYLGNLDETQELRNITAV